MSNKQINNSTGTILYIKSMVCIRCKMAVQSVLASNQIEYRSVELGRVLLVAPLTADQKDKLVKGLAYYQLYLMDDPNEILVERIKTEILGLLQSPHTLQLKLSVHLSQALDYNYTYLANLFSEHEGMTLEKYYICQRVERIKEFIVYENMSLSQITDELAYSSLSHLCMQFKKVTGLTPAEFKKRCLSDDFLWRAS